MLQGHHAGRAARLEEGRLRLHDRHERRDDVDDADAELPVGRGHRVQERVGLERGQRAERRRATVPEPEEV